MEMNDDGSFDTAASQASAAANPLSTQKTTDFSVSDAIKMDLDSTTVPDDVDREEQSRKEEEEDKTPART